MDNYRLLLKLEPDNVTAMNNLAFLLEETGGDVSEAESFSRRALEKEPNAPGFVDTLALIYLKKGQVEAAAPMLDKLVRTFPHNPVYRYHFGQALMASGQTGKAKSEWQKALYSDPSPDLRATIESSLVQPPAH